MSDASAGVGFLTLAYLIEIAVVINLAYRELKFPELHNKVFEKVNSILLKAEQMEIPQEAEKDAKLNQEYLDLKSLVEKNGENDESLWGEHLSHRRVFFNKYIRNRLSLRIVNKSILATIGILIGCTWAAPFVSPIVDVFSLDSAVKWVWVLLLIALTGMTVLPLWFIYMATLCEKHLLGFAPNTGVVQKIADKMFYRREQELKQLKSSATYFKAPQ